MNPFKSSGKFLTGGFLLFVLSIFNHCKPLNANEFKKDPTAKVETKIHVTKTSIRIELIEYTDDLIWIHGMESDDDGLFDKKTLNKYLEIHKKFLETAVELRDVDGNLLKPTLVDEGDNPFEGLTDGKKLNEAQLIRRKMSYTYQYSRSGKEIDLFSLRHKIIDSNFLYPGEMSISIYQGTSDLPFTCKLRVDTPLTVPFDWENPFPNKDAPTEVIKQWLETQSNKMLGVTEFGSVYFWGYIEQRRLRVELLVPLNVIDSMIDIPAKDKYFLTADEIPEADKRIRSFFSKGNPIAFDGEVCKPQVQNISFFPANQRDFAIKQKLEKISFVNGRVGITIFYPYRQVPKEILATWDKYTRAADTVDAYFYYGEKAQKKSFKRVFDDNQFLWKNQGDIPIPEPVTEVKRKETHLDKIPSFDPLVTIITSIALVVITGLVLFFLFKASAVVTLITAILFGIGSYFILPVVLPSSTVMKPHAAQAVSTTLLKQVYRAFDFAENEKQYDSLRTSAAGKQLTDLFLNLRKHLLVEEQGGAISNIEKVNILSVQPIEKATGGAASDPVKPSKKGVIQFQQLVDWELVGLVEHWGHSHQRTNKYQAVLTVEDVDGSWKIVDLKITSQSPGTVKPRPRKFQVENAS